jgi:RNA polymerase sigma factor (sigma-70 family)
MTEMPGGKLRNVLGHINRLVAPRRAQDLPDQVLLTRFVRDRDEAAFAALLERHGAMVLGVCGRVLKNAHDAEDACQAVFLVLARKADSVRKRGSLGSWLHGVAWRVARKLRSTLARRSAREIPAAAPQLATTPPADLTWREVLQVLDEELNRLPAVYKAPLVLCHLEGRTQDEAARELGWTLGALRGRLERGRAKLRARLLRRGLTASAALASATLAPGLCPAAVPPSLVVTTLNASLAMATGRTLPAAVPPRVVALAQGVLREGWLTPLKTAAVVGVAAVVVGALALGYAGSRQGATAPAPAEPRTVEVWTEAAPLEGHQHHVWSVAFSPDGTRLASGAGGFIPSPGELRLWDAATGRLLVSLDTPQSVRDVAFAPDGKTLATAEHDGMARLRDAETGAVLRTFKGHQAGIDAVSFSRDGKALATSSWDHTVKLWDTATGDEVRTLTGHSGSVFAVACGDGTLASGGVDGTLRVWDVATGQLLHAVPGHQGVIHWVAYAPDGQALATAGWDRTVRLWAAATGKPLGTLRGHTDPVLGVAFSPDGRTLASCASQWMTGKPSTRKVPPQVPSPGEVIVWDLPSQTARARLGVHQDRVFGLAFSPDGNVLAVAGWDGSIRLWKRALVAAAEAALQAAPQAAPAPRPPANLNLPLRGKPENRDDIELIGPNAEECVRFEPEGLRITLPAGYPGERPNTGVRIHLPARGDFEATVSYEILGEPAPADAAPKPTKLMLQAQLDRPDWTVAALTRRVDAAKGHQFTAWTIRDNNEDSGKRRAKYREFPAEARAGRLRVARSGSEAAFSVAEGAGADFTLLHQCAFGDEELEFIDLVGSTGGPRAALDVRFTDLRVTAPGQAAEVPAAGLPAESGPRSPWKIVLALAVIASLAGLGAWVVWHQIRRARARTAAGAAPGEEVPAAAPALAFKCPGCGKGLKARAGLAGKKLKCPGCGQAVCVPESGPAVAPPG